MAKDPAFLLYSSDFLTGTIFMTNEEAGVYIKLLCIQHQKDGRINPQDFDRFCSGFPQVAAKFKNDEKGFFNERLEQEILKRLRGTEASRNNGSKGGRPKSGKVKNPQVPKTKPKTNLSENANEIENRRLEFIKEVESFENYKEFHEAFIRYWTEPNTKKTKMKFELNETWSTIGRLATWKENNKNRFKQPPEPQKSAITKDVNDSWPEKKQ